MPNDDVFDFIEGGDPFDPKWVETHEDMHNASSEELDKKADIYLRNKRAAYLEVFSPGPTGQAALDFVMRDLAVFCRAYTPTFDLNSKLQDLKEGRREVFMRIMDYTVLTHEALYNKVVNAPTTGS